MIALGVDNCLPLKRMSEFARELKKTRVRRFSQQGLAEASRVSVSAISKLETGKHQPSRKVVEKLSRALDLPEGTWDRFISPDAPDDDDDLGEIPPISTQADDQNVDQYSEQRIDVTPPLYHMHVAAGHWVEIEENGPDHGMGSMATQRGLFRIRIRGDSMEPDFPDGSIVEFECLRITHQDMQIGLEYYIQRDDGCATFKRLKGITNGDDPELLLEAINKGKYPNEMRVLNALVLRKAKAVAIIIPRTVQ